MSRSPVRRCCAMSASPSCRVRAPPSSGERCRQDHDGAHHHGLHGGQRHGAARRRRSWAVPPHRRPSLGIGYAPEDRRLFSAFTVEENILLPGRVAKLSPEETKAAAGSRLLRAAGAEGARQASGGIGLRGTGQDGGARPRAHAWHQAADPRRAVPGPRTCPGAALRGSAPPPAFPGQGHYAADHGTNPKLLETFAD